MINIFISIHAHPAFKNEISTVVRKVAIFQKHIMMFKLYLPFVIFCCKLKSFISENTMCNRMILILPTVR